LLRWGCRRVRLPAEFCGGSAGEGDRLLAGCLPRWRCRRRRLRAEFCGGSAGEEGCLLLAAVGVRAVLGTVLQRVGPKASIATTSVTF
jgi:hypothetical protein